MASINNLPYDTSLSPYTDDQGVTAANSDDAAPAVPKAKGTLAAQLLAAQATDGQQGKTTAGPASVSSQTAPVLPPASGTSASAKEAASRLAVLSSSSGGDNAASGVMAFLIMFDAMQSTQRGANTASVAQQQASSNASMSAIEQQIKQIQNDKASAWVRFGGSAAGAATPLLLKAEWGPALGQATGQMVSSGVDAANQSFMFGAKSYDAQVQQKEEDLVKTLFSQSAETTKQTAKQAESGIEMALRTLGEYFQRKSQTETTIANNV